ncbi:MAG TPA: hypothetical protein VNF92_01665 [Gemmatimonadaceae bacterium]|nr:hypothetical protein [Gemmatimonadaceae bacterium]
MNGTFKLQIALCLFASLLGAPALAQAPPPNSNDPTVTLDVSPSTTPPNGTITVSGLTYPQPGVQVLVTITPPGGAPTVLTATPDTGGRYQVNFSRTASNGMYRVRAQAGKKGVPAYGQFTVMQSLIDIDDDVADNKALLDESAGIVKGVKQQVDNVPDSPAKSQMETKLDELDEAIKTATSNTAHLPNVLQPYKTLVQQRPDAEPSLQPFFDHLAQLDIQAQQAKETYAKQIAQSKNGVKTCDAIDQATQALRAVPDMIEIAKKPWQFAAAFGTNMAQSELPASAGPGAQAVGSLVKNLPTAAGKPTESLAENELEMGSESEIAEKLVENIPESVRATPGYAFAVTETKKFVPSVVEGTKGPLDLLDKATSLAGDLVAYANERLFAQYCEKFQGSFTATMLAHFYSKPNGEGKPTEWWTYSTAIKGTLVLRYPKEATGKAVALSGQIEGGATRFTYKENVFSTDLYGSMAKGGTVYLKDVAPAATDNGAGGMVNALTSPTSFYIPVTGQYANGQITIVMGNARTDFSESYTRGHTFYVVIAPTTLMLPVLGHFTLPYTNAHFILDHVVKDTYTVHRSGMSMLIVKNASKDFPGKGNLATYTINLKACNPACP